MTKFLESRTDADVLAFVRDWVSLLASEQYAEAHRWLYRSDDFTPQDLKEWIVRSSGSDAPRVNAPSTLDGTGEQWMIAPLEKHDRNGRQVIAAEYFLPIDDEWSSVRASFYVRDLGDGTFGVELTDISMA